MGFRTLKLVSLCLCLSGFAATIASAQVNLNTPWLRATVPGQKSAAVFMELEAHSTGALTLIGASSPVADSVEIREARRHGRAWKVHATQALEIPAGSIAELKPGRSHLLLLGLHRRIRKGDVVPITLHFERPGLPPYSIEVHAYAYGANAKAAGHTH